MFINVVLISLIGVLSFSFGSVLNYGLHWDWFRTHQKEVAASAEPTLLLTHVLFRHGNRAPDLSEMYPKDPYFNYSYYPLRYGDLTNTGKVREYAIGKALRQRYDSFLGNLYVGTEIDARSTDRNRTKMSLLLVLASLYPPKCSAQNWYPGLNWQPIPYNYVPIDNDPELYGIACPKYVQLYEELQKTPEVQAEYAKYQDLFDYISENTGLNVTKIEQVYDLSFSLSIEDEEFGLKLPSWTEKVWPDVINEVAFKQYDIYMKTEQLKKIAIGYFLRKVITDTEEKIDGTKNDTKIYLYSAHENNLGQLFTVLDLFEYPHIPPYGSYVLFEIYYQDYKGSVTPRLLKLPSCEEFCALYIFKTLVQDIMPDDSTPCGA